MCQGHAPTLVPRRVSPLRGRHIHRSFITQAVSVRQLPGVVHQRWLSESRIDINISKSTAIFLACTELRFIKPRPVTLSGEPIQWVDTTRYLGLNLDSRLTWSRHINQITNRNAQIMSKLGRLLNSKNDRIVRNGVLVYKQFICPMMDYACPRGCPPLAPMS